MVLKKLQELKNMRNQAIFFREYYLVVVIQSILKEENIYLYALDLYDMDKYLYNWDITDGQEKDKVKRKGKEGAMLLI